MYSAVRSFKDRAFWFVDYEGFRERVGTLVTSNMPTAAQRAGIFPTDVTNPLTGKVYPAGTGIPQSDMQPLAAYILNTLPLPNWRGQYTS